MQSSVIEFAGAAAMPPRDDRFGYQRSLTEPLRRANSLVYEIEQPDRLDIDTVDALRCAVEHVERALNARVTRQEAEALLMPLVTDRQLLPTELENMIVSVAERDALDHVVDGAIGPAAVAITVGQWMRKPSGKPTRDQFFGGCLMARMTIEKLLKRLFNAQGIRIS